MILGFPAAIPFQALLSQIRVCVAELVLAWEISKDEVGCDRKFMMVVQELAVVFAKQFPVDTLALLILESGGGQALHRITTSTTACEFLVE